MATIMYLDIPTENRIFEILLLLPVAEATVRISTTTGCDSTGDMRYAIH